jgi:hypothetical protein
MLSLDTVIWMGDFNYRIGLGAEKVKQLIKMGDLETLYENDQVRSLPLFSRVLLLTLKS